MAVHKRMKRRPETEWLVSDPAKGKGRDLMAGTYNERYYVVETIDYDAPKQRRWLIMGHDLETGASITLQGEFQRDTRDAVIVQLDGKPPYKKSEAASTTSSAAMAA